MKYRKTAGYISYGPVPCKEYTTNAEENMKSAAILGYGPHPDDTNYIRRFLLGDAEAFEALMLTYQHTIYSQCLRMMGQRQDALDMSQEAMQRIYRSLSGFRAQANFSTWIYRIITNVCIDGLRRRKRTDTVSLDTLRQMGYEHSGVAPSPESIYISKENRQELAKAFLSLPPNQRTAVVLRDVQNLSYKEVANALSINLNTIKSRISRGRQKLRLIIGENAEQKQAKY